MFRAWTMFSVALLSYCKFGVSQSGADFCVCNQCTGESMNNNTCLCITGWKWNGTDCVLEFEGIGMSGGAIAGIAVACCVALVLLGITAYFFLSAGSKSATISVAQEPMQNLEAPMNKQDVSKPNIDVFRSSNNF